VSYKVEEIAWGFEVVWSDEIGLGKKEVYIEVTGDKERTREVAETICKELNRGEL
jgi:hypothetical protein